MKRSWSMLIAVAGVVIVFFSMLAIREQRAGFDAFGKQGAPAGVDLYDDPALREISERSPTCATSANVGLASCRDHRPPSQIFPQALKIGWPDLPLRRLRAVLDLGQQLRPDPEALWAIRLATKRVPREPASVWHPSMRC